MRHSPRDPFVAVLLAASAATTLGVATFLTARGPATTEVQKTVQEVVVTVRASFKYDVEMTKGTSVWPAGARLESDRALYSYVGAPVMHLHPVLDIAGLRPGEVVVQELLAVDMSGATLLGKPLWSAPAVNPATQQESLALPGDRVSIHTPTPEIDLDVGKYHASAKKIREELGFLQSQDFLTALFTATVKVTSDGQTYELPLQAALPIHLQEDGFAPEPLDKAAQMVEAKADKVDVKSVPVPPFQRALRQLWWFVAGLALALATVSFFLWPRGRLDPAIPAEHRRFKDWITVGTLNASGRTAISVQSLEGLVDLAIDMNKRAIFDPAGNRYYVIDGEVLYIYSPGGGES